jgi:predicted nucleic acid-binding protein
MRGRQFDVRTLLLANGLSPHFPKLFGASLPAISGATIIGLSIVVTGALLMGAAMTLRRSTELRRLLDDLYATDLVLGRADSTAARIRRFKVRAEPQKTLG